MQQVRIKYLRNHDWVVLPLESIPKRRVKKVFGRFGFEEAVRALETEGESFQCGRIRSEWVTNRGFIRFTGMEVIRLRAVLHGFEVELKMIRKWQLDEGDPRIQSDEESDSSSESPDE